MRQPEEMSWYEVAGSDGFPRAVNGIKRLMPEGAKEITAAQAAQISRDVRAREPKRVATRPAGGETVDLTQIQNQLEAHSQMLVEQAHALDDHESKIKTTQASVAEYLQGVKAGKSA